MSIVSVAEGNPHPLLTFANRTAKILAGASLGAFFFSSMTVMSCVMIFHLGEKESLYRWITGIAFVTGIAAGATVLWRAKWWHIGLVAVVVLAAFVMMMSQTE